MRESADEEQDNSGDVSAEERELDSKYWIQDYINLARELGIGKKQLMEDYYPDETILLLKRQSVINKRREKASGKEKDEEVPWDKMGI